MARMGEPKSVISETEAPGPSTASSYPVAFNFLARTFQAFRYRDFRLMWFGSFTSTTGTWMQQVAESWVVLSLTGSAFYLGITAFLGQLPIILFTLIGGVIADRVDRRRLLLASQYIQMLTAFILATLLYFDWIQIWHFLVLVFVVGSAQAFGGPAYQAIIPGLVGRKDLPNAIALNSVQFNLARVIGPVLAGLALAVVGPTWCFGLNGISFLAVIASLYLMRSSFQPDKTDESVMTGVTKGLAYLRSRGGLWQLTIIGFFGTFCGVPVITLLPVFAKDIFQTGSTGYSTMMAISGAGSVMGALVFASLSQIRNRGRLTLYVQVAMALLIATFALSEILWLSYIVLFLGGGCLITLFASINSLVQLNTVEEMRGRVMSIFMLAFRGGMPLGSLAAGALASGQSPATALLIMAGLLGASSVCFLVSNSRVKEL